MSSQGLRYIVARKARSSQFVALFQSVVPPSVFVRSSRVPSVARLALPPLGFRLWGFVLRAGGARFASFRRLFALPLGRFLPALALRTLRGSVLRYRSVLPPLRSFGAPLPPPTWLTPAFWLLSVWLLCVNRVAPRFGRAPRLTHNCQVALQAPAILLFGLTARCVKIVLFFHR